MTTLLTCGGECADYDACKQHWGFAGASMAPASSVYRSGAYGIYAGTTAVQRFLGTTSVSGKSAVVGRLYVYWETGAEPTVNSMVWRLAGSVNGATVYMGREYSTSKLVVYVYSGWASRISMSGTISLDTWYRVDFKWNGSAGTFDWQVDGTAQTQLSITSSTTAASFYLNQPDENGIAYAAGTTRYDDVLLTDATGDYPLGAGSVYGYNLGVTSGTHNQTAGDLKDEASTNVTDGDSSGGHVDEVAPSKTDYIKQVVARSTTYWEGIYATSGVTSIPRGVMQSVGTRAVTAGANDQKAQLYDGTSAADTYALTSTPTTSHLFFSKNWDAAPSTGAWTIAKLQACRVRWGFSTTNTATYPPAITWSVLEAEFAEVSAVNADAGLASGTGACSGSYNMIGPVPGCAAGRAG